MKKKIIAKRYAEAFLSYSEETFGQEKAIRELKQLKFIFSENPDFYKFLDNLEILQREKSEVIDNVLKDFSEESRIFLKLLLEHGRLNCIIEICDYVRINYSYGEALEALLKTSLPLDLELIKRIKTSLEHKMKRKLNFHIELDANLLGGVQFSVNNIVLDGSVRKRLAGLKEKLMAARI